MKNKKLLMLLYIVFVSNINCVIANDDEKSIGNSHYLGNINGIMLKGSTSIPSSYFTIDRSQYTYRFIFIDRGNDAYSINILDKNGSSCNDLTNNNNSPGKRVLETRINPLCNPKHYKITNLADEEKIYFEEDLPEIEVLINSSKDGRDIKLSIRNISDNPVTINSVVKENETAEYALNPTQTKRLTAASYEGAREIVIEPGKIKMIELPSCALCNRGELKKNDNYKLKISYQHGEQVKTIVAIVSYDCNDRLEITRKSGGVIADKSLQFIDTSYPILTLTNNFGFPIKITNVYLKSGKASLHGKIQSPELNPQGSCDIPMVLSWGEWTNWYDKNSVDEMVIEYKYEKYENEQADGRTTIPMQVVVKGNKIFWVVSATVVASGIGAALYYSAGAAAIGAGVAAGRLGHDGFHHPGDDNDRHHRRDGRPDSNPGAGGSNAAVVAAPPQRIGDMRNMVAAVAEGETTLGYQIRREDSTALAVCERLRQEGIKVSKDDKVLKVGSNGEERKVRPNELNAALRRIHKNLGREEQLRLQGRDSNNNNAEEVKKTRTRSSSSKKKK